MRFKVFHKIAKLFIGNCHLPVQLWIETGIDKATKTRYTGEKSKNEVEKWYNAMNAAPCTRKQCAAAQTAAVKRKYSFAPNSEFEEPKNPYVQLCRPYGMPMNNRMNGYAVAGFVLVRPLY